MDKVGNKCLFFIDNLKILFGVKQILFFKMTIGI